jgi:hypothetical protein
MILSVCPERLKAWAACTIEIRRGEVVNRCEARSACTTQVRRGGVFILRLEAGVVWKDTRVATNHTFVGRVV